MEIIFYKIKGKQGFKANNKLWGRQLGSQWSHLYEDLFH